MKWIKFFESKNEIEYFSEKTGIPVWDLEFIEECIGDSELIIKNCYFFENGLADSQYYYNYGEIYLGWEDYMSGDVKINNENFPIEKWEKWLSKKLNSYGYTLDYFDYIDYPISIKISFSEKESNKKLKKHSW